jgi:hypothetical protein
MACFENVKVKMKKAICCGFVTTKVVRLEPTKTRSHKGTKKEKVVTAKVDSSAPLRPRLNPRAKGSPEVQLRAKKQAEARYVSSYKKF